MPFGSHFGLNTKSDSKLTGLYRLQMKFCAVKSFFLTLPQLERFFNWPNLKRIWDLNVQWLKTWIHTLNHVDPRDVRRSFIYYIIHYIDAQYIWCTGNVSLMLCRLGWFHESFFLVICFDQELNTFSQPEKWIGGNKKKINTQLYSSTLLNLKEWSMSARKTLCTEKPCWEGKSVDKMSVEKHTICKTRRILSKKKSTWIGAWSRSLIASHLPEVGRERSAFYRLLNLTTLLILVVESSKIMIVLFCH